MSWRLAAALSVAGSTAAGAQEADVPEPFLGNTWVYKASDGIRRGTLIEIVRRADP